jgi:hypothetical protein
VTVRAHAAAGAGLARSARMASGIHRLHDGPPSGRSDRNALMAAISDEDTAASSDAAVGWLTEKAKQFSDDADELRGTTDRAAKGLGALATAGLTAVGIAKVGDLYPKPSPGGYAPAVIFLWLGFAFMVVAIVGFVYRFWRANRPLALSARIAEMWDGDARKYKPPDRHENEPDLTMPQRWIKDVSVDECKEIADIYADAIRHAAFSEGDGESLAHYEWRADRLERNALYLPESPSSTRVLAQVERMRAEIEKAEERAKLVVVRRRMNHVFNRWLAAFLALMFVVGLVMFATAADHFDSKHTKGNGTASQEVR